MRGHDFLLQSRGSRLRPHNRGEPNLTPSQFDNPSRIARKQYVPWRLLGAMALQAAAIAVVMAWGEEWSSPPGRVSNAPVFRYVNSGWIAPHHAREAGAFSEELRAFVIVDEEELDDFEDGFVSKVSRGNATTLGRIDFEASALIAAYYVWRPVRGDPLSVADVRARGSNAVVELDLSDDPQGREYPYLYAPMIMVAVERSLFPEGEPVNFSFELNGEPALMLTATPN